MKKIICISAFTLLVATQYSCNGQRINGSGNVTTETRNVGDYEKISLKGSMDIEFTQGPARAAVIEAEDNVIPYVRLEVHGDELVVDLKDHISLKTHKGIKIRLTAPDVNELALSGSGNIHVTNTLENANPVRVKLSGSGNIEGAVNSPEVKASSAGSGNIRLAGETKDLEVSMAGSGDFEGADLHSETARVTIAGSGNADVHASVKLDAKIAGSGDVSYKGNPEVSSKIAGSGSVHKN
jgi:carbon monoxide dehydrogenase subunit G